MEQEIFNQEIALCQKLNKKHHGHCAWGECDKCGVIPLLYKLGQGKLYEAAAEVQALKQSVLQ